MIAVGTYTAAIVSEGIFLFVAFSTVPHSAANIGSILAFFLIKMFQLLLYTALYNCVVNVFTTSLVTYQRVDGLLRRIQMGGW